MIVKIFLSGWVILITAILLNFLVVKLDISTWYSFIEDIGKNGFIKAFKEISIFSKLFLFIIYPLLLGFSGLIAIKFFSK